MDVNFDSNNTDVNNSKNSKNNKKNNLSNQKRNVSESINANNNNIQGNEEEIGNGNNTTAPIIVNNTNSKNNEKKDVMKDMMMGMMGGQNSDLMQILNEYKEKEKKFEETINNISDNIKKLSPDIKSKIDKMSDEQDEKWEKKEKEIKKSLDKNGKIKALEKQTDAELAELLSILIIKMDKDCNIAVDDLNDFFEQMSSFVDNKDEQLALPADDESNMITCSQSKGYIGKISKEYKRIINDRNSDYGTMRNEASKIITENDNTYVKMKIFALILRAIKDFFATMTGWYINLHEAVPKLDQQLQLMIKLTRQYEEESDQKKKDDIAREIRKCMATISYIKASRNELSDSAMASIKNLEQKVNDNFVLKKINAKGLVLDIIRIVGSDITIKAFDEARKQQGNGVNNKMKMIFSEKKGDLAKKYDKKNAVILSKKFFGIENGDKEQSIDDIAEKTGMDKEEVEKIMNGTISATKKAVQEKYNKEIIVANARYRANNYIINSVSTASKKSKIISGELKSFIEDCRSRLNELLTKAEEISSGKIEGNMGVNLSYFDNIEGKVDEIEEKLREFSLFVRDELLSVPEDKSDRDKKIDEEKGVVNSIEKNLDDWIGKNQNDKKEDNPGDVKEIEEAKGLKDDLDNVKEIKCKGYENIAEEIEKALINLKEFRLQVAERKNNHSLKNKGKSKIDIFTEKTKDITDGKMKVLSALSKFNFPKRGRNKQ